MQYIVAIKIIPASFVGLNTLFLPSLLLPILAPSQSFLLSLPLAIDLGFCVLDEDRYSSSPTTTPNPTPHPSQPLAQTSPAPLTHSDYRPLETWYEGLHVY